MRSFVSYYETTAVIEFSIQLMIHSKTVKVSISPSPTPSTITCVESAEEVGHMRKHIKEHGTVEFPFILTVSSS